MHFMKTCCNGKISQFSGFQNHLQTISNLHILSVGANSKNPACHDWPCTPKIAKNSINRKKNQYLYLVMIGKLNLVEYRVFYETNFLEVTKFQNIQIVHIHILCTVFGK